MKVFLKCPNLKMFEKYLSGEITRENAGLELDKLRLKYKRI